MARGVRPMFAGRDRRGRCAWRGQLVLHSWTRGFGHRYPAALRVKGTQRNGMARATRTHEIRATLRSDPVRQSCRPGAAKMSGESPQPEAQTVTGGRSARKSAGRKRTLVVR